MYNQISMNNYRAVDRNFDKRMAKKSGLPLWLRIVHAAAAEMNRSGHAHFGGWSNIAEAVSVEGEPEPKRAGIYKALTTAIEFGYIDASSDAQCILFDSRDTQKSAHGSYGCKYNKHSETWRSASEIRKEIEKAKSEVVDTETGEILEGESPVFPSEETVVSEEVAIIPAADNSTEQQDEAPEVVFDGPDEILASANTPYKAKGFFYNPGWRRDLEDQMARARTAVQYANENSNNRVTVGVGDDGEW